MPEDDRARATPPQAEVKGGGREVNVGRRARVALWEVVAYIASICGGCPSTPELSQLLSLSENEEQTRPESRFSSSASVRPQHEMSVVVASLPPSEKSTC